MEIEQVANKKQLNEFISFPYSFYKNSPAWIPPLRLDQRDIFSAKKNRILQHSDYAFFLLKKGNYSALQGHLNCPLRS